MLTKKDRHSLIQDMKEVFATKDDLKQALKPVNRKLDTIITYFDRDISWHNRRLKQIEDKIGVKAPEFVSLAPIKN